MDITVNIKLSPIALRLRSSRIKSGLSQEELASKSNIALEDIIEFELDRKTPSLEDYEVLMEILHDSICR